MWIVWFEKKILKTLGFILGIIIILITALHLYVVNNAERLVEELVQSESKDKLRLKVKYIRFNYFSKKVELDDVSFFSNDSLDLNTTYYLRVKKIKLIVKALLPIFTRQELRIDLLSLTAPEIEVTRLRPSDKPVKKEVSIPQEMGRVYNSIMDALKLLEVNRFEFDEGKFRLVNNIHPDQKPLEITDLHFRIENFRLDTLTKTDTFQFTDQMIFRTRNQDITFPDGHHRLAFSRFRINIQKREIEIDSCTLSGKSSAGDKSGFTLFLDTLKLTDADFKALYEKELIRADSVYCLNPHFKITIESKPKKDQNGLPGLDSLIRQLAGDMQFNYVGVINSSVDITTIRNGNPTTYASENNNFEMRGLLIDQGMDPPLKLDEFDMAIRNYENYLKDSSYVFRFDSIRLRREKILLSNFSINTEPYKDNRNIRVRQFVLTGLNWPELVVNHKIIAQQASLISPVIDYTQPASTGKKTNAVKLSVEAINEVMKLDMIHIADGMIKVKTRNGTELMLENASLSISSNIIKQTPQADEADDIIEELNFKKGRMNVKNWNIDLDSTSFIRANKHYFFRGIVMEHTVNKNYFSARNVFLDSAQYIDSLKILQAEAVSWSQAKIIINELPSGKNSDPENPLRIFIKNIQGSGTDVDIKSEKQSFSFFLNSLSAKLLDKKEKLKITGLKTDGRDFNFHNADASLTASNFNINDQSASSLVAFRFNQEKKNNKVSVVIPELLFTPIVKSFIEKNRKISDIKLYSPEFTILTGEKDPSAKKTSLPDFEISSLEIVHPVFRMENAGGQGLKSFYWNGAENNMRIKNVISDVKENRLSIASMEADFTNFSLTGGKNKTTASNKGTVQAELKNIFLQAGDSLSWGATAKYLTARNFSADTLGKKAASIRVSSGKIENLTISSENTRSLRQFIEKNQTLVFSNISGRIENDKNKWFWENLSYNHAEKILSLDSLSFHPAISRDSFIAASPWQTDYMTFHSANISVTEFNPATYLDDSVLRAGNLKIESPYFTAYRDKRPPFHAGIIKPLPSKMIQKIPEKISVDTVLVSGGTVVYTELSDKTGETGVIPITRISGDIFPIKNINLTPTDTFRIRLNGYLLDSAWIRLRTRESYMDSLSGFLITLRMRPRSLTYLNEFLPALASIRIQSGYLDTLSMRAIAHEYLSLGEMRMFYHNLKIQFLKNSVEEKKKFLTGLATFIANNFVIRKANTKKVGIVYFPRVRDKSFINYYIKIALSGAASSAGAKKNKKQIRRYEKQLKIRHMPPVDFEF